MWVVFLVLIGGIVWWGEVGLWWVFFEFDCYYMECNYFIFDSLYSVFKEYIV